MNRKDKKIIKKYNKYIDSLYKEIADKSKGKTLKEQRDIEGPILAEIFDYWREIKQIQSRDLIEKAEKYGVLLPDYDEEKMWEKNQYDETYLSQKGQIKVKIDIRKEVREKWKFIIFGFATFASLIIGLLGAISVIISIIKK